MKKNIIFIISILFTLQASPIAAATKPPEKVYTLTELTGHLLVEKTTDRIWYAEPVKKIRYIIRDDADVRWLRDTLTIAVPESVTDSISDASNPNAKKYTGSYRGRIISSVPNDPNDAWYIHPATGRKYLLDSFTTIQALAKKHGIVVGPKSLAKLTMTKKQAMFDPLFLPLTHVRFDGERFSGGRYSTTIMPLASLTKLMTALVILDQNIDFNKEIVITGDQINYPKTLVGDDVTSEVPLKAGDTVRIEDLWISLLLASSNQSAVILADATGLSRDEFVHKMNEKAAYFGLRSTRFSEMAGLNPSNVSTAEEMAILAHRAFSKYRITEASIRSDHAFTVLSAEGTERTITVTNRNYSLLAFKPQGAKTGYLTEAQRNVALKKDGSIIVVLHAMSMKQRNDILTRLLP